MILHPLLRRQLQQLGLQEDRAPTLTLWQQCLVAVSKEYSELVGGEGVEHELDRRLRETLLLNRVIAAIASAQEPTTALATICEELARAFDLPQAAFALLNEEQTALVVAAEYCASGRPSALGVQIPVANNPHTAYVIEQRLPVVIRNVPFEPRQEVLRGVYQQRGTVSLLIVPLVIGDRVVGTLGLDALDDRVFSDEEIALAQNVAAAASQALEKVELYAALQQELAERRRVEAALRESEQKYRSVVDNAREIIFQIDAAGCWTLLNPAWQDLTGFSSAASIGTPFLDYVHPDEQAHLRSLLACMSHGQTDPLHCEVRLRTMCGDYRSFDLQARNALHQGELAHSISGILHDITERKVLEAQLTHQAFHDPLSQLPNRTLFMERLSRALARHERCGGQLAVLFLDLDNFKVINDSLGHHSGDRLLVMVADRLAACLRPEDTAARLGGDEFTVLLEEIAGVDIAIGIARRIQTQLQVPFYLDGHEVFVTSSIGIALNTSVDDVPDLLLRNADIAMYRAKHNGRARLEVYDQSMNGRVIERMELENDLRRALSRGEFRVYYQPVVDLVTGRISEVEALVRWEHPQRGLIAPSEFISLAEETGLILPLGRFVLEEACRQVKRWQLLYPSEVPLLLSVNLSGKQFQNATLESEIREILHSTGLDPTNLKLEITESVMMQDAEATVGMLSQLKALGIKLAIDDFGTGYSSLVYLQQFPLDILKIDRSFVSRFVGDAGTMAIVRAIITLSRSLNLLVTGEGIETAEQLARLQSLGCDLGQGFLFARPLPADEMQQILLVNLFDNIATPGSTGTTLVVR